LFNNKRIWLIGCSEGIGYELAQGLASQGAKLSLSARNEERLSHLKDALEGDDHRVTPLDVTDLKSVQDGFKKTLDHFQEIDMVIYNPGSYEPMGAKAFDYNRAEMMLDVNFRGALRMLSSILPYFIKKNSGRIVLVGSIAGYRGLSNAIGYGASKSALIHLSENLKLDLKDTNIDVTIINPGFVKTRLTDKNAFTMPGIISSQKAAEYIIKGLEKNKYEITFPFLISFFFRVFYHLPQSLYFLLMGRFR
jgi:short-subunit dehydrogenase